MVNGIGSFVRAIDRKVGRPMGRLANLEGVRALRNQAAWQGEKRYHQRNQRARAAKHGELFRKLDTSRFAKVVEDIERDGFARIPQAFDAGVLATIRQELEASLSQGSILMGRLDAPAKLRETSPRPLTPGEFGKGEADYRSLTNYVAVHQPLYRCPTTIAAAFHDIPLTVAAGYLGCVPAIGGANFRKSFVNDIPEMETQKFHADGNAARFVKFFFYLNDVDEDGGPFSYVRGSHKKKFGGWLRKSRWETAEIEERYGKENVMLLTGKVGDLVIANTTGFHRGTKPRKTDRSMLTVNYVVAPEYQGRTPPFWIGDDTMAGLSPLQRAAADQLQPKPAKDRAVGMSYGIRDMMD